MAPARWRRAGAIEAAHALPRVSPAAKLRRDPAGEALLAVLPERAVRINQTGREVLALCEGERSAEAIATELASRHPDEPGAWEQVHAFLDEMTRLGVVENSKPS